MNTRIQYYLIIAAMLQGPAGCRGPGYEWVKTETSALGSRIEFFDERLNSTDWKVRYCLLGALQGGTPEEKNTIERLVADEHRKVRNQAMRRYVDNYVEVDRELIYRYFDDFYMLPVGLDYIGTPDIRSLEFHKNCLSKPASPSCVESIICIGLLGRKEDAAVILPFLNESNPYILNVVAKTLYRLGRKDSALECFGKAVCLPADNSGEVYHQIRAIQYLAQVDLDLACKNYEKLRDLLNNRDDLYPRTVSEFTLLGLRLKKLRGNKAD